MSAALVAVGGLFDLAGALAPRWIAVLNGRELLPPSLQTSARPLLLIMGLALLLVARALLRGSRLAWAVALIAAGTSTALDLAQDIDPVVWLFMAGLAGWLAASSDAFRMRAKAKRLAWLVPASLVGLVAYGLIAWSEVFEGLAGPALSGKVADILRAAFLWGDSIPATTPTATAFVDSLHVGGIATLLLVLISLATPAAMVFSAHTRRETDLFIARVGRSSMAPLATVPGNKILDLLDGRAIVGLKVYGGVAVTVGGPVCDRMDEPAALEVFINECERRGWTPALVGVSEEAANTARALGLVATMIGEEAILDVADFTLSGSRMANVRHSATRARREGVAVSRYTPQTRNGVTDGQLTAINEAWLESKGGPEMGFTLGSLELDHLDRVETFIASVPGRAVGFVTWLSYREGSAAVLDLTRRSPDAPPGTMELLISESMTDFADRGRETASLSAVPILQPEQRTDGVERLLGWLYDHASAVYEVKGLYEFKNKFSPRWEPIYLAHPAKTDLPRIGLALGRAYMGDSLRSMLESIVASGRRQKVR